MKVFPVLDGTFEDYFNLTMIDDKEIEGYIYYIATSNSTNFLCTVTIHRIPENWKALFAYQITRLPSRDTSEYPELTIKMNSFYKDIVRVTRDTDEDYWGEIILNYLTACSLNEMIDSMDTMCILAYDHLKMTS